MFLFPSQYLQKLQDDPIFLSKKDPELLIIAFVSSLEHQAKSKLQMRTKFQEIENIVNDRVKKNLINLTLEL